MKYKIVMAALAALSGGCMVTPTNNQQLSAKTEQVAFSGFTATPSALINLYAKDDGGNWTPFVIGTTSSTSAQVDAIGQQWYAWNASSRLPQGPQYWRQVPGQRKLTATVSALAWAGWNEWSSGQPGAALLTYDVGSNSCMERHASGGGGAIMQNCASAKSPEVTLTASCGSFGNACCEQQLCDGHLFCEPTSQICQTACGLDFGPCCSNDVCGSGLQCQSNNSCRSTRLTYSIGVQDMYSNDIEDANGDEPMFLVVGFRSTPGVAGSTDVFWGNAATVIANDFPAGYTVAIPASHGNLTFPNVRTINLEDIKVGKNPELLGMLVIAIEHDATPLQGTRDFVNDKLKPALKSAIASAIESRNIVDIGANGVNISGQQLLDSLKGNWFSQLGTWLASFSDKDDMIAYRAVVYVAADTTVPLPPSNSGEILVERLRPMATGVAWGGNDDLVLSGNGATYSVTRYVRKQ